MRTETRQAKTYRGWALLPEPNGWMATKPPSMVALFGDTLKEIREAVDFNEELRAGLEVEAMHMREAYCAEINKRIEELTGTPGTVACWTSDRVSGLTLQALDAILTAAGV
jgi:hypothetical protein